MKKFPSLLLCAACAWSLLAAVPSVVAQLAITEVMSSAANRLGTNVITPHPDFWELTNFGTNTVDLADYRFSDSAGLSDQNMAADALMFAGQSIAPSNSIILFQSGNGFTNAAQFRSWWGETNLLPGLQIYAYQGQGRGLHSSNDAVQLWRVTATSTTAVDRVELYIAQRGFTFTYDPDTGLFDSVSALGEGGSFKAVEANDVGSPGYTTGPVPLAVIAQPQSQTVDGGSPATFTVQARGLPKPGYQWHFNGTPIPGAVSNVFEIPAALPGDVGTYTVALTNGRETLLSAPAGLLVDTTLTAPRILQEPADLIVFPGQTAVFQVKVRGYELPAIQWQFDGRNITGATNSMLLVPNAGTADSGHYSVRIQNSLGSTNASATLAVRPRPNLLITEVMGSTATNTTIFGRSDWWELTNFDTNAVNLRGYRFDDDPGVLEGAVVITNDVIIRPGESVLFIQDMTPEFFTEWWGEENLPENVQFVRYFGNGFDADGDSMTLWNATPVDVFDKLTRAEYSQALNPDFSPIPGPTQTYWCEGYDEFGWMSVVGECGAVQAARSEDVGSPGYVADHPPRTVAPRCLGILRDGADVQLTWRTQAGKRYELLAKDDLQAADWTSLSQHSATGALLTTIDTTATNLARRFYQLRVVP